MKPKPGHGTFQACWTLFCVGLILAQTVAAQKQQTDAGGPVDGVIVEEQFHGVF